MQTTTQSSINSIGKLLQISINFFPWRWWHELIEIPEEISKQKFQYKKCNKKM